MLPNMNSFMMWVPATYPATYDSLNSRKMKSWEVYIIKNSASKSWEVYIIKNSFS